MNCGTAIGDAQSRTLLHLRVNRIPVFEHVPPRAAYNDQRVFEADIHRLVQGKWDGGSRPLHGQWVDGGAGKETICGRCNELTGHWYGSAYVNWARQALRLVTVSRRRSVARIPVPNLFPAITEADCGYVLQRVRAGLQSGFSELVRFVLNKYDQHMPCGLRVFSYLLNPTRVGSVSAIRHDGSDEIRPRYFRARSYARLRAHCEQSGQSPWDALVALSAGVINIPHCTQVVQRFHAIQNELRFLDEQADTEDFVNRWLRAEFAGAGELRILVGTGMADAASAEELLFAIVEAASQPEIPPDVTEVRIIEPS